MLNLQHHIGSWGRNSFTKEFQKLLFYNLTPTSPFGEVIFGVFEISLPLYKRVVHPGIPSHYKTIRGRYFPITLLFFLILFLSGNAQTLNRAEYFWDTDPGTGNGTSVAFTPGANADFSFNASTAALSSGFHSLNVRFRDNAGHWSHFASRMFYIIPPNTFVPSVNLVKAEYYFDADPGTGSGTNIPVTPGSQLNLNILVPTTSLGAGFHSLNVRVKDNEGRWSHFASRTFFIVPVDTSPVAVSLKRAEYFFDNDPGTGLATPLPLTAGNPQTNSFTIETTGLAPGFHTLVIRYQDNQNRWGHFAARTFFIVPGDAFKADNLVRAEYFIDVNPETDPALTGTELSFTPAPSIDQLFELDASGLAEGSHEIYIRVKDDKGFWSTAVKETFTVLTCVPPSPPTAPGQSRCGVGVLTFNASGATGAQVYRWYENGTTSDILFTGSPFETPELSATTTYYVSIFDPATLCESNRTAVNATVTVIDKPVINPSGTLNLCEGNAALLAAPEGFSQYLWSNGQTTQQILVNAAGTFTVQTGDGICTSEVSDEVTVTMVPAPPKPVVTVTGNTTICGTGSVELIAPDGFEYLWSTGSTEQAITVSATGVYYLVVRAGGNCPSLPSDPVVVNVLTPPCGEGTSNRPPVIDTQILTVQIEGLLEADLTPFISDPDNNLDFSSLRVVNNQTSQGVPASVNSAYFLVADYAGLPFTGTDRVTVEVCDLALACAQQIFDIEITAEVVVYNGLTPDGDGFNDFMFIKYLDVISDASQNKVTIFNRWGDVVFDVENYNNTDRVFRGLNNKDSELPSGTYFYKIEFRGNIKPIAGFITLVR
ncbi:MAG: gliding motility-associated C-terminal domain-containing protein [Cyclobacteriaceae bacterium]|nr:gliding motility-associated C-terminal domain-containing protein [Cyclobacteriaceae bacterium]